MGKPWLATLVLLLAGWGQILADGPPVLQFQAGTVDGRTVAGSIRQLSSDSLVLTTPQGEVTLPGSELLSLTPEPAPPALATESAAWVTLIDGSRLPAETFQTSRGSTQIKLPGGEDLKCPAKLLRSVRFAAEDTDWEAAEARETASGDLLVVRRKEAVDFLEGVIGDVGADTVQFQIDGETLKVKRGRVLGLIYFERSAEEPPAAACVVQDARGLLLYAKSVTLNESRLNVTTVAGPKIDLPLESVVNVDFSAGKLTYLADLKPEKSMWTGFFDLGDQSPSMVQYYAPRVNRGREPGPLLLDGKAYKHGLSLYSRTELTYRLPAGSKKFQAIAGIDDIVSDGGSVTLTITADGRTLFSEAIRGQEPPRELDLDVGGVKRLTILVDFGDDLDVADYLNLCDARIVK